MTDNTKMANATSKELVNAITEVASVEPIKENEIMVKEEKVATSNASDIVTDNVSSTNTNNNDSMSNFSFNFNMESAVRKYDNKGAYETLQAMMERNELLTVKFYTSKDNKACAWIESKHVSGFKYELNNDGFNGLLKYMFNGEISDFDSNPKETETLEEGADFQRQVMKMMIEAGKTIQYVPRFRERSENIVGFLQCCKGKIVFRVKRTEETVDYLLEMKQAV